MNSRVHYTTEIGRMRAAEAVARADAFRAGRSARPSTAADTRPQVFYRRATAIATVVWRWR